MADGAFAPRERALSEAERARIMAQYGVVSCPETATLHHIAERAYDAVDGEGVKLRAARRGRAIARRQKFERAAALRDAGAAEAKAERERKELERFYRYKGYCDRNLTAVEIAAEECLSPNAVRAYCAKHGLSPRPVPQAERKQSRKPAQKKGERLDGRTTARHRRMIAMAKTGQYTIAEIAAECGGDYDTVHRYLWREGLSTCARPAPHKRDDAPGISGEAMQAAIDDVLKENGWTWEHVTSPRWGHLAGRTICMARQRDRGARIEQMAAFWGIKKRSVRVALRRHETRRHG